MTGAEMTGENGQEGVSEATAYLLPKDSLPPRQTAVYRLATKAQSAEEGREYVPPPPAAEVPPTLKQQADAALFYATASLLVTFVNKVRMG